jgi:hypothetical protein
MNRYYEKEIRAALEDADLEYQMVALDHFAQQLQSARFASDYKPYTGLSGSKWQRAIQMSKDQRNLQWALGMQNNYAWTTLHQK